LSVWFVFEKENGRKKRENTEGERISDIYEEQQSGDFDVLIF
jgi:hypothetical protein